MRNSKEGNRRRAQRYRERHPELCRERVKACYEKNKDKYLARVRAIKKQYVLDRRCTSCSRPLVQGENKTCVNCGNTMRKEIVYATHCARATQ